MNLIENFWRMHDEYSFGAVDAFLYFYLLKIYRSSGQKKAFAHSSRMILAQLNISKPTLDRSRKKLKSVGLIGYVSIPGSAKITWSIKTPKETMNLQ
jgi:replication initiation and membrane attachment protein DnaB